MSSLLALLSQQTPNLQTRKGLVITGLQNDFLSPDGKLPVTNASHVIERLKDFVPAFREFGNVIWVRSEFEANREVSPWNDVGDCVVVGSTTADEEDSTTSSTRAWCDSSTEDGNDSRAHQRKPDDAPSHLADTVTVEPADDEELFLTQTDKRAACCIGGSFGAAFPDNVKALIDDEKDMQVTKTYYSAFGSTSLLLTLRSKLITELCICGCMTNLSVFATAMDAARYGIKITLVEDCLGYRKKDRHDLAIKQLREIMGADIMTSEQILNALKRPHSPKHGSSEGDDDCENGDEEGGYGESHEYEGEKHQSGNSTSQQARKPLTDIPGPPNRAKQHSDEQGLSSAVTASAKSTAQTDSVMAVRSMHSSGSHYETPTASLPSTKHHRTSGHANRSRAQRGRENTLPSQHHGTLHAGTNSIDVLEGRAFTGNSGGGHMGSLVASEPSSAIRGNTQQIQTVGRALFGDRFVNESSRSFIDHELLPNELADCVFERLSTELSWQRMRHQTGEVPRLVCCQCTVGDDGSVPVYRHPSDQTLDAQKWTPTVAVVRQAAEEVVGHPLNHALIQLYRGGTDYISEHSDKTLDLAPDSYIANVSFGAERTMRLRTKRAVRGSDSPPSARITHRVRMPHNSIIAMSLTTNAEYLHGINADKRPSVELSEAEKAYGGQRISLTFRRIATFLNEDSSRIWGQGATGKKKADAKSVINGDSVESEKLVRAFGAENQSSGIDWASIYGNGFDVLHLK